MRCWVIPRQWNLYVLSYRIYVYPDTPLLLVEAMNSVPAGGTGEGLLRRAFDETQRRAYVNWEKKPWMSLGPKHRRDFYHGSLKNHRKTIGKWWFNGI